jgi:hypothetical protein
MGKSWGKWMGRGLEEWNGEKIVMGHAKDDPLESWEKEGRRNFWNWEELCGSRLNGEIGVGFRKTRLRKASREMIDCVTF